MIETHIIQGCYWTALGVAIGALMLMAMLRNIVRAGFAFFLLLTMVAVLMMLKGADYAAMSLLIVYVGGVLILLLFAMMTTGTGAEAPSTQVRRLLPALGVVGLLGGGLLTTLPIQETPFKSNIPQADLKGIGFLMLTDYILLFEVLSVFLLIALIGVAFISRIKPR